jgi:hypothetical protein
VFWGGKINCELVFLDFVLFLFWLVNIIAYSLAAIQEVGIFAAGGLVLTKASKTVYLVFGIINVIILFAGAYFMVTTVFELPISELNDAESPYVSYFFFLYTAINFIFLFFLAMSSVRLFKFNPKGISLLKLILKIELVYFIVISLPWLLVVPKSIGYSAAGASGIGNMGIAPQIFIVYPITGLVALWILKLLKVINSDKVGLKQAN